MLIRWGYAVISGTAAAELTLGPPRSSYSQTTGAVRRERGARDWGNVQGEWLIGG
jgi:hypothetical protein